ncbi:MAG: hypothetical protein IPK15_20605 [Verrucomicrobia bacterium]|nr:hypothetical protein [Verrucomicrobiota bacterium]
MKAKLQHYLLVLLAVAGGSTLAQAQGTAFNYQGRLVQGGVAVSGSYDFIFTVHDAETDGNALSAPAPVDAVAVSAGQFAVPLDFGAGVFTGAPRWLEIAVRINGGGVHSTLAPRQALLPTPYSIYSATAGSLPSGTVTANQLNTAGPAPAPGQFLSYDGGSFLWADPGVAVGNIWSLSGSSAYYNAGNVGIGTSTPAHRLSVIGGPAWTANGWLGSVELPNGSALGWQANAAGQRFGMGHANTGFYLFRTASNPGNTISPALYDFVVNDIGSVGIGVNAPTAGYRLEVAGSTILRPGNGSVQFGSPNGELGLSMTPNAGNRADLRFDGTTLKLLASAGVSPPSSASGITINAASGNVGIGGSPTPTSKLEVVAQDALSLVGYQPFLTLHDANAGYARSRIQGVNGEIVLEPESFVNGSNPNSSVVIANSGNVSVRSLTIRGGADVAEPFELTSDDIAKGSVVVIDDKHAGKLKLSTRAYDTQVAGIVSGANGINPGISLYQQGALEGGQNVALSGRVYVKADASTGAIKPGDLLTTSSTPGHAMKVSDHSRSQGAILGKAMSGLKDGQGLVLVLVTLQ